MEGWALEGSSHVLVVPTTRVPSPSLGTWNDHRHLLKTKLTSLNCCPCDTLPFSGAGRLINAPTSGSSLVVQWLTLSAFTAKDPGEQMMYSDLTFYQPVMSFLNYSAVSYRDSSFSTLLPSGPLHSQSLIHQASILTVSPQLAALWPCLSFFFLRPIILEFKYSSHSLPTVYRVRGGLYMA